MHVIPFERVVQRELAAHSIELWPLLIQVEQPSLEWWLEGQGKERIHGTNVGSSNSRG